MEDYKFLEIICSYEPKKCDDEEKAKELLFNGFDIYIPAAYREQYNRWEDYLPSVVNLVTLSIDHHGKYLGCAHRQASEQRHIISADFSSPGFIRHAAAAGNWRAMLNVHAVVSPEVLYRIKILAHMEDP